MSVPQPSPKPARRRVRAMALTRVLVAGVAAFEIAAHPVAAVPMVAIGSLAMILIAASAVQLARPDAIRLARGVAQIDLVIATALVWSLDHDLHRRVFWVAMLALAEVAAVLGRRWVFPALAVTLSSYLLLEAVRPGHDAPMALARVGLAITFSVAAYATLRRAAGRDERLRRVQADMVEARRAADEIRDSEQRHRALVEEVPVVSYRVDAASRRLDYVSPQLETVFGHAAERWLEAGLWQEWVHPDDRDRVSDAWSARAVDPSPSTVGYRLITGHHRILWVVDRDQAVCDDAGCVVARHGVLVDITERRAAEAATRRSESNFRLLAENAPIGIFRVDPAGWHRYANDCACAIAGTTAEQLQHQGWSPSIHEDDRARVLDAWERAGSGSEPIEMAYRFQRPDGELRWVETRAVPLLDGDGGLLGYQGTISDITDRCAAEEALRASEQRYRLLADHAPVGIFELDPARGARYANPRMLEIAGIGHERFSRDGLLPQIHPDDREAVLEAWERTADSDEGFDLHCRLLHADGTVRWVRVNGAALPDRAGYQGVMIDVTEEHLAGEALRASEQRLRDVFDTVDLLATITTVDGKIAYINEALAASVGRTAEELAGSDWIETLSADADAEVVEYFYSELRAGRIVRHDENSIETGDGRVRLIAWSNTILRNADGSVFGAASIGEDVTDQRAAAAALRDSEERFRTLSELAPVGIFHTDAAGGLVYVNEHWSEITGMTLEQAAGREWTIAVHPDHLACASAEWARAAADGERFSRELRFRRTDGSEPWVHATAVALLDGSGAIEGYLGTAVDVTERLAGARAIVESERRLRTLTENMADVIFVYGMDRRLQYVTPSFEELTGFTVGELYQRNFVDDVHPEDAAGMRMLWRGLFDGESYSGAEFRIINRDGTEKWCWSSGSPILDERGVQIGVQIRDADISGLKRAEQRLRESEERARSIIETTSDAYLAADERGIVLEWNGAAERVFGREREEALGQPLVDLIVPEQARARLADAIARGRAVTIELAARHRDAGEFPAELTLWHVELAGARTVNVFARDITERRLREEQVTFMAYHDTLTGLPNRAMFEQHLELVLVRARHDGTAAGVLYMDVDRFKLVNDTLGHEAGDDLLREVAARLRKAARSGDLVVRLGGDEFVLVLGDLPAALASSVAAGVAARVQEAFAAPFQLAGQPFHTTASIGVALFPDDAADANGLVTAADAGMYVSKRAGRGRTSFAPGSRHAA